MIYKLYTERIKWLLITILPGFYRVFLLALINMFLHKELAGFFSSDFTISTVLIAFSGLGFSTYIIKEISSEHKYDDKFSLILISSFFYFLILTLPLIIILYKNHVILNFFGVTFFVISSMIYQCVRGLCFARKSVTRLLSIEVLIYIITLLSLFWCYHHNYNYEMYLYSSGLSYLLPSMLALFMSQKKHNLKFSGLKKEIKSSLDGVKLGFSNVMTTGLMFCLPSFARLLGADEYISVMAICASVVGLVAIFPRTYINMKLPEISKKIKINQLKRGYYLKLSRRLLLFLLLFSPLSTLFIMAYLFVILDVEFISFNVLIIVSTMIVILSVGQVSFLDSRFIIFTNRINSTLVINSIIFLLFIGTYIALEKIDLPPFYDLMILLASILSGYVIRLIIFKKQIDNYFKGLNYVSYDCK